LSADSFGHLVYVQGKSPFFNLELFSIFFKDIFGEKRRRDISNNWSDDLSASRETVISGGGHNFSNDLFSAKTSGAFSVGIRVTRDRCYNFLNIFAEKFCEKMAFLTQSKAKF
jgi:hypothetical protein